MSWRPIAVLFLALTSAPALAVDAAHEMRETMRAALLEQAPAPSGPAALPDRDMPVRPETSRRAPSAKTSATG